MKKRTQLSKQALGNFIEIVPISVDSNAESYRLAKTIRGIVDNFEAQHLGYFANLSLVEDKGGIEQLSRFINQGVDPINESLTVTNWTNFGIYDIAFCGQKPFCFQLFDNAPFPWLSSIMEGFSNRGLLYSAVLPSTMMKKVTQPDALRALHRYRSAEDPKLDQLARLPWLL